VTSGQSPASGTFDAYTANEAAIRNLYESVYSTRELKSAADLFDDSVTFHLPGRNRFSGDWDKESWPRLVAEIMEMTGGSYRGRLRQVLSNDEYAVALVTISAERDGTLFEWERVNVYRMAGGKIAEVWESQQEQYAVDEFFGPRVQTS
jgi:uncharacterized protein